MQIINGLLFVIHLFSLALKYYFRIELYYGKSEL